MTTGTEIQARVKSLGLTQADIAAMLRVSENTIYRQFTGVVPLAGYVLAFLAAWAVLSDEQRRALRADLAAR